MSRRSLSVLTCGMITAVGLDAPASCAAIRGRLDNFQETRFLASDGSWIVGAEVMLDRLPHGPLRLAHLVAGPIRECLSTGANAPAEDIPLLLGVAELDRPGRLPIFERELLAEIEGIVNKKFHPASKLIPLGRVAGAYGIQAAAELINEQNFTNVVIAGVDSYLVADTLFSLDQSRRLLTAVNSNGFIPGEAGSAILVGSGETTGLQIRGLGFGLEEATIESGDPLKANGLILAIKGALEAAGVSLDKVDYRVADLSGETYGFKEAALALTRTMRTRTAFQDLWHPADCIGEVGAAVMPCLLAVAWWAARKGYAPGPLVLVHVSNDDGRRIAVVLDSPLTK